MNDEIGRKTQDALKIQAATRRVWIYAKPITKDINMFLTRFVIYSTDWIYRYLDFKILGISWGAPKGRVCV